MKSSGIGGQAVLEGVMMKNKSQCAVAVRKPDNKIEVVKTECKSISEGTVVLKLPIFRGMAVFVESLALGIRTLTTSSEFCGEGAEENEIGPGGHVGFKEAVADIILVGLSVFLAVAVFILFPLFISRMLGKVVQSDAMQLVVEGFLRIGIFIGYVALVSQIKDVRRVFMYHGAEHKCINCVEQGYELTIANVKKQSRRHKHCSTSFLLVAMLASFVLFMFIRVDAAWLRYLLRIALIPVVAGLSYEFIRLAGNTDNKAANILARPGLWMQGLTTREPDDSMIEVAIASIEAVFDWRAYQENEGIAKYNREPGGQRGWWDTAVTLTADSPQENTAENPADATSKRGLDKEAGRTEGIAAFKESQKELKNKVNTEKKSDFLISMSVFEGEEDDDILRALDKYFVYEEEKAVMEKTPQGQLGEQLGLYRWKRQKNEKGSNTGAGSYDKDGSRQAGRTGAAGRGHSGRGN